jgi:hypothetical protein
MKIINNQILLFAFISVGLIGLVVSSGCRKKKDTIAIIHVKNVANQPVSGARVILYGKSTINQPVKVALYDTTQTDSEGKAVFNYNDVYQLGQAGVAILNIKATYNSLVGEGIIKVEEETTSEETVFLQ